METYRVLHAQQLSTMDRYLQACNFVRAWNIRRPSSSWYPVVRGCTHRDQVPSPDLLRTRQSWTGQSLRSWQSSSSWAPCCQGRMALCTHSVLVCYHLREGVLRFLLHKNKICIKISKRRCRIFLRFRYRVRMAIEYAGACLSPWGCTFSGE